MSVPEKNFTSPTGVTSVEQLFEADPNTVELTAEGGDWQEIVDRQIQEQSSRMIINMGPAHPSTHGVMRLCLELDGDIVTNLRPAIGYLHTGIEKTCEARTWTQGSTLVTRADYVAPLFNEAVYVMAVEEVLGVTNEIPELSLIHI